MVKRIPHFYSILFKELAPFSSDSMVPGCIQGKLLPENRWDPKLEAPPK